MRVLEGKSVFSGIAIGKISILQKADTSVKRTKVENPEAEITRVQEAKEKAVEQLQKLYDKALREVGESGAAIFEVHQMMLDDEDYLDSIDNIIRTENVNAEYAVATTGDNFADMFAQMDDDYMKARAADVKDISDRLVRVLSGHDEGDMDAAEPSIIVAEDLAPSETVQMDKSKVLAFVTRKGSSNSHTAILARTMNIPALINIDNAIKYTPPGSVIFIRGTKTDGKAQISVEDNGPGIPEEMKSHIFEMFYTGKTTVADSHRSLGLGLALCHSIIEAHEGTLVLTDHDPHGCNFTFTLPLSEVTLNE